VSCWPEFCAVTRVEVTNVPKRHNLEASMTVNQRERLRRSEEFEVAQNRLRANQIETMIAEFDRICIDLGQQIEAEEKRARISDPTHFAYPTYAKAARERRARVQQSADALRNELDRLRFETTGAYGGQFAA
jgi:flagellar protein FliJ